MHLRLAAQFFRAAGIALMLSSVVAVLDSSGLAVAAISRFAAIVKSIPAPKPAMPSPATAAPQVVAEATMVATADNFYAAVQRKDYARATQIGQRYLDAHPKEDAFAVDLAYAYVALNRYAQARAVLQGRDAYLRAHPQSAAIWLDIAYKESDAKQYRAALADVNRYLKLRPGNADAIKARDYLLAELAPPPPPPPDVLFYQAVNDKKYDVAIPNGVKYLADNPSNDAFAVDLAFAYLAVDNIDAATAIADRRLNYLKTTTQGAALMPALFYAYSNAKRLPEALTWGDLYLSLHPEDDKFAMDVAYADIAAGRTAQAKAIAQARPAYFKAHPDAASLWMDISYKEADEKRWPDAMSDVDQYLSFNPPAEPKAQAVAQRKQYEYNYWGGPRYSANGYAWYESRFPDTFFGFDQTYILAPAGKVQPYAWMSIAQDTRSGAPGSPQIYSDNAIIADLGLRSKIGPYLTAYAAGGAGIGLNGQGTISDLRYGLQYNQRWNDRPKPYTDINADASFYSRFGGNYIMYYQALHDFGGNGIRPVLGINGGLDTQNIYGNNFVEGLAGFQTGSPNVTFRFLGVEGSYLTRGLTPRPKTWYTTFRGVVFFSL